MPHGGAFIEEVLELKFPMLTEISKLLLESAVDYFLFFFII